MKAAKTKNELRATNKKELKPIEQFDLFIFDWDGTLIEAPKFFSTYSKIKKKLGLKRNFIPKKEEVNRVIKNLLNSNWAPDAKIDFITKIEMFFYEFLAWFWGEKLKPGAKDLILSLKKRNKKIAILTEAKGIRVKYYISKYNLDIDYLLTAKQLKTFKPSPIGIYLLLFMTGVPKKRAIIVGDTKEDILSGKLAKIKTCAVGDGFGGSEELRAESDYFFSSFEEFAKWLNTGKK